LGIPPQSLGRLFSERKGETLEDYRRFYDSLGDVDAPAPPPPADSDSSRQRQPWRFALGGVAHAQEQPAHVSDDEVAIRAVLEAYRMALEAEDLDRLADLHDRMTDRHREGLARYFASARDLHVRFSTIEIAIAGDEALVSYTREDSFNDERSGRPVRLDTRLSRLFTKRNGEWKIGDRKEPS